MCIRDSIWTLAWDEGACSAPRHIRNSTLLDHLGGLYGSENFCKTAFEEDCWSANTEIFDGQLTGIAARAFEADLRAKWTNPKAEHGGYPCTDPDKDITLPPPKFRAVQAPPLLQAKYREKLEKKKLFSFAGDVGRAAHIFMGVPGGRTGERYSHGIRQALAKLWMGREDVGMHIHAGHYRRYYADLQDSVFCGVLPGDGWSGATWEAPGVGQGPFELSCSNEDQQQRRRLLHAMAEARARYIDGRRLAGQRHAHWDRLRGASQRAREAGSSEGAPSVTSWQRDLLQRWDSGELRRELNEAVAAWGHRPLGSAQGEHLDIVGSTGGRSRRLVDGWVPREWQEFSPHSDRD